MKQIFPIALLASACILAAPAHASTIIIETANANPGAPLANANAYRSAVNTALKGPTYASKTVPVYDGITHSGLFGGRSDFALKSTISFGVAAADAGLWSFRAGLDFTYGGALFIDDVAVDVKSHDVWWAGQYTNPTQFFSASTKLSAGNHTVTIYGFEGCCDGALQAQFKAPAGQFTTFSNNDQLVSSVPEASTYAMLLAGLGLLTVMRRRAGAAPVRAIPA